MRLRLTATLDDGREVVLIEQSSIPNPHGKASMSMLRPDIEAIRLLTASEQARASLLCLHGFAECFVLSPTCCDSVAILAAYRVARERLGPTTGAPEGKAE